MHMASLGFILSEDMKLTGKSGVEGGSKTEKLTQSSEGEKQKQTN
jgi:hypothetical protein